MMNDGFDNWLSEDIEVSKQRLNTENISDVEMMERWHRDRFRESCLPAEFWNLNLDDNWISKQDVRGNDLTSQQAKKKQHAVDFTRKYINVLPYLCRGKVLKMQTKDKQRSKPFQSLVIIGGQESGKSFLAAEVAKAAVLSGEDVRWYDYCALASLMLNKSFHVEEEQSAVVEEFKTMALIIIDALDTDAIDDRGKLAMKTLARARKGSGLPYIITCKPGVLGAEEHPMCELVHAQYAKHLTLPSSNNRA